MSQFADIIASQRAALEFDSMSEAFENLMHQLQLGEEFIAAGADELFRRWQASAQAIGKLCAGTERWQAAFRQMQAPINLAEILRART